MPRPERAEVLSKAAQWREAKAARKVPAPSPVVSKREAKIVQRQAASARSPWRRGRHGVPKSVAR